MVLKLQLGLGLRMGPKLRMDHKLLVVERIPSWPKGNPGMGRVSPLRGKRESPPGPYPGQATKNLRHLSHKKAYFPPHKGNEAQFSQPIQGIGQAGL